MKLLALDAAGSQASAALWAGNEARVRCADAERGAGEQLLGFVDALLAEAGLGLAQLDAIAFGRGPGAFTGLRLAASLTQGLAFSAGLPVIPVPNLEALAGSVATAPARLLACQDARMGEVYWAGYEAAAEGLAPAWPEAVSPPSRLLELTAGWRTAGLPLRAAGSALAAYPAFAEALRGEGALLVEPPGPAAAGLLAWALRRGLAAGVPAEQAVPVYVRDDVARPPG